MLESALKCAFLARMEGHKELQGKPAMTATLMMLMGAAHHAKLRQVINVQKNPQNVLQYAETGRELELKLVTMGICWRGNAINPVLVLHLDGSVLGAT